MRTSIIALACVASATSCAAAVAPADGAPDRVTIGVWNNQLVVTAPATYASALPNAEQRMTVAWNDTTIDEAADLLRKTTGLNVVCLPGSGDRHLTLTVRDMPLRDLVTWMARQTGLHAAYQREALVFSPTALSGGPSVMRMYDITALVTPVHDFPGPEMQIPVPGGKGAVIDLPPAAVAKTTSDPEELAEFIRRQIHTEE